MRSRFRATGCVSTFTVVLPLACIAQEAPLTSANSFFAFPLRSFSHRFRSRPIVRVIQFNSIRFDFNPIYPLIDRFKTLTDHDSVLTDELVGWHLKVERGRSLPDPSTGVVVRSVAGAEPSSRKVTGVSERDASQVGADSEHNSIFRLEGTVLISLLVTEVIHAHRGDLGDLVGSPVADKDGLTAPLDSDGGSDGNLGQVILSGGSGQHIGGSTHGRHELEKDNTGGGGVSEPDRRQHQVREGTALWLGNLVHTIGSVSVINGTELMELRTRRKDTERGCVVWCRTVWCGTAGCSAVRRGVDVFVRQGSCGKVRGLVSETETEREREGKRDMLTCASQHHHHHDDCCSRSVSLSSSLSSWLSALGGFSAACDVEYRPLYVRHHNDGPIKLHNASFHNATSSSYLIVPTLLLGSTTVILLTHPVGRQTRHSGQWSVVPTVKQLGERSSSFWVVRRRLLHIRSDEQPTLVLARVGERWRR